MINQGFLQSKKKLKERPNKKQTIVTNRMIILSFFNRLIITPLLHKNCPLFDGLFGSLEKRYSLSVTLIIL